MVMMTMLLVLSGLVSLRIVQAFDRIRRTPLSRLSLFTRAPLHYGFCPLVKLTFKDLAKLTAFAAIFKTKSYFR